MKHVDSVQDPRDLFASTVALICHPVFVGILGLLTVVFTSISNPSERLMYLVTLTLLTFAPAALYLFVHFKGNVSEMLELIDREARLIPYLLMIGGAIGAVILLTQLNAPRAVFVMTLVLIANEIVMGTINFWTKVSIHTATATFTAITLGYLIDPVWYAILFLVPLIAWARVFRRRHTINQVVGGSLVAAIVSVVVIFLSNLFLTA